MNLLQFMSDSPFLTFILALALVEVLCVTFKALGGKYRKCPKCGGPKE